MCLACWFWMYLDGSCGFEFARLFVGLVFGFNLGLLEFVMCCVFWCWLSYSLLLVCLVVLVGVFGGCEVFIRGVFVLDGLCVILDGC